MNINKLALSRNGACQTVSACHIVVIRLWQGGILGRFFCERNGRKKFRLQNSHHK